MSFLLEIPEQIRMLCNSFSILCYFGMLEVQKRVVLLAFSILYSIHGNIYFCHLQSFKKLINLRILLSIQREKPKERKEEKKGILFFEVHLFLTVRSQFHSSFEVRY